MENREIIFRGKTYEGKWVYGLPTYLSEENYSDSIIDGIMVSWGENIDVDPKTVGQYTGLKDKNGKEIFEGDILNHRYRFHGDPVDDTKELELIEDFEVGYIVFKKGCFTYISRDGKSEMCGSIEPDEYDMLGVDIYEFEIIGNIHDTPELIGGK